MSIISIVRVGTLCSLLFFIGNITGADPCGGYQTGESGRISFPEPESDYARNKDCIWHVTAPDNAEYLLITFQRFDINTWGSPKCGDFLQILRADNSTLMNRCDKPVVLENLKRALMGNKMTVHFHSDDVRTGKGFSLKWEVKKWRSTTPERTTTTTTKQATTAKTIILQPITASKTTTSSAASTKTSKATTTTTTTEAPPTTTTSTKTASATAASTTTLTSTTTAALTTTAASTTTASTTTTSTTTASTTTENISTEITSFVPTTFVHSSITTPDVRSSSDSLVGSALILGYAAFSVSLIINIITCFFLQREIGKREKTYMSPICRPQAPVQPTYYESLSPYDDVIIVRPSTSGAAQDMSRLYSYTSVTNDETQKTIQTYPLKKFSKDSEKEAQIRTGTRNERPGRMEGLAGIMQSPEIGNPQTEQIDAEYIEITM